MTDQTRRISRKFCLGLFLCAIPAVTVSLSTLEDWLLENRYLNKKDMTFVGNETGTAWEHIMNVWHWDAALFGFMVLSLPSALVGLILLASSIVSMCGCRRIQS